MKLAIFVLIFTIVSSSMAKPSTRKNEIFPIVFIPGQGGNQLEARFDKTYKPYHFGDLCPRKRGWHNIWLNMAELFFDQHCPADNLKLVYNATSGESNNVRGVEIKVPYFGKVEGVEYLDPDILLKKLSKYAAPFFDRLVKLGYKKNIDLVAAPYDFRRGAYRQISYDEDLKKLIVDTYAKNNKRRIMMITHSLGGLMAHQFLDSQPYWWKKTYVEALITMSSPWGGTVKAIKVFTSGNDFGVKIIDPFVVRSLYRTFESSTEAFPSRRGFDRRSILVQTPQRNYTISDFEKYFRDIRYPQGYGQYKSYDRYFHPVLGPRHPGVDTHVLYSTGVRTMKRLVYGKNFPDGEPTKIIMGNGDGTVNYMSLRPPKRWNKWVNKRRYGFHQSPSIFAASRPMLRLIYFHAFTHCTVYT